MRKDFTAADASRSEEDFVSGYWDAKWVASDPGEPERVRAREEYRFVHALLPALEKGGLDVLDCGCGRGEWTRLFLSQGHRALGLDIAPQAVARLRERHGDAFRVADFRATGLPDASFDLIINWGGIEHFEEGPASALIEAHRLLRAGGLVVVSTPCDNARIRAVDRWNGTRPDAPAPPGQRFYQYRFTPDELTAHLMRAGFPRVTTRMIGGEQGITRAFQHELAPVARLLPAGLARGLARGLGAALRPLVGHMIIAGARRAV